MNDTAGSAKQADPTEPQSTARSIVSLLLFIHLFIVAVAMLSFGDSARSSMLFHVIKQRVPGLEYYLDQLWLDHAYDYHWMNDLPLDWDHHIEATIYFKNGDTKTVTLPPADLWPSERRQHYEQMAKTVAQYTAEATELSPDEEEADRKNMRKSLLPASIGGALLQEFAAEGAERVVLKCIYHQGITPDTPNPNDPRNFVTAATVAVVLGADGVPQTLEVQPAMEVSPVAPAGVPRGAESSEQK